MLLFRMGNGKKRKLDAKGEKCIILTQRKSLSTVMFLTRRSFGNGVVGSSVQQQILVIMLGICMIERAFLAMFL